MDRARCVGPGAVLIAPRGNPRIAIGTTPRPTELIKELVARKDVHVTKGSTWDNAQNLPEGFLQQLRDRYEGTRLGRQEIDAEILLDTPGAGGWFTGMAITNGAPSSTDTVNVCAKIGGTSAAEKNTFNVAGNLGVIVGSSGAAAGPRGSVRGGVGVAGSEISTVSC